jgi:ribosomal protein S18 acetylase RimI-like enzyme
MIRPYREEDRAAVYDICIRTGAAGEDARGLFSNDDLIPDIYAGPYVELEPELAFVLVDPDPAPDAYSGVGSNGQQPVGYVLGTADTARFVRAYRDFWIPRLGDRYPEPRHPPRSSEDGFLADYHRPERMLLPELADYPAHLHIDLLPSHQGAGYGRELIETWLRAAARAGALAVHLAMAAANGRARSFYHRLGFHRIGVPGPGNVEYLGRSTS